ncbi:hypothetical protein B296_00004942 [Ensete ventricosum]|uniref:Uncharacterized protein n=1 Tax=Ensete ventricosum TaxID=4639 RepID=A0A426ZAH6_ENSVE|nr:hypothetical protein B296_00004942 [Ensete ventricosum]
MTRVVAPSTTRQRIYKHMSCDLHDRALSLERLNSGSTQHWPAKVGLYFIVNTKVFHFELYCPIRVVHTGLIGYRYADRPLSGDTIEIGVSQYRDEATPRLPEQDEVTPRLPEQDEATPPLPEQERGDNSSTRAGRRNTSSLRVGRGDAPFPARDEATPPSPHGKRHRLVSPRDFW